MKWFPFFAPSRANHADTRMPQADGSLQYRANRLEMIVSTDLLSSIGRQVTYTVRYMGDIAVVDVSRLACNDHPVEAFHIGDGKIELDLSLDGLNEAAISCLLEFEDDQLLIEALVTPADLVH